MRISLIVLLAFGIVAVETPQANAAWVTTDEADYDAGDVAIIYGSGWSPGEVVALEITGAPPLYPADTLYGIAEYLIANDAGNVYSGYVVPGYGIEQVFTLTLAGESSGLTAQTSFTNAAGFAWIPVTTSPTTGPTVTTDLEDYYPYETVLITGSGWAPGETVALEFVEDPMIHEVKSLGV